METSLCSTVGASTRTVNVDLGCLGCDAGGGSHVCGAGAGEFGQSLEEVAWERSIWSVSIVFFFCHFCHISTTTRLALFFLPSVFLSLLRALLSCASIAECLPSPTIASIFFFRQHQTAI